MIHPLINSFELTVLMSQYISPIIIKNKKVWYRFVLLDTNMMSDGYAFYNFGLIQVLTYCQPYQRVPPQHGMQNIFSFTAWLFKFRRYLIHGGKPFFVFWSRTLTLLDIPEQVFNALKETEDKIIITKTFYGWII